MQSSTGTVINDVVSVALTQYSLLPFAPQPGKYTVLASFALHSAQSGRTQLLSLGAGVKCLPASRLPALGDALHDSHAEVIARRGAIRWLLEEVQRDAQAPGSSTWICAREDGLYALRDNVHLWMYASTVPCALFYGSARSIPPTPRISNSVSRPSSSQVEMPPWVSLRQHRTPRCPRAWTPSCALFCRQVRPPEAVIATHASVCFAPNLGARTHRAYSACRAATRSRAGPCSAYRVHSRVSFLHRCISTRLCLAR